MEFAQKIKDLISDNGLKVAALERDANLPKDTVRNLIRGITREPAAATVYALANTLGFTMEELMGVPTLGAAAVKPAESKLPIRFKTGAGAWVETADHVDDFIGELDGAPIAGYRRFPQWYEQVEGDSMNRILPDGIFLHVVDAVSMGYRPRQDDIVIVERTRDGGQLRERSAKQVEITPTGKVELWPRSTNPRWQEPLQLNEFAGDETVTVQIAGLVRRAIMEFRK